MGKYLNFRLHPLNYGELLNKEILDPEEWKVSLYNKSLRPRANDLINKLLAFSGFPEPYFEAKMNDSNIDHKVAEKFKNTFNCPYLQVVQMPGL